MERNKGSAAEGKQGLLQPLLLRFFNGPVTDQSEAQKLLLKEMGGTRVQSFPPNATTRKGFLPIPSPLF